MAEAQVFTRTADRVDVVVGRRCIVDQNARTVAYDLLLGEASAKYIDDVRGEIVALAEGHEGGLAEMAEDNVLLRLRVSRDLLTGSAEFTLPVEPTLLDVGEVDPGDHEVLDVYRQLVAAGYTLCVDGRGFGAEDSPVNEVLAWEPVVRIDLDQVEPATVQVIASLCDGTRLLAENVRTQQQWDLCVGAGFALFQGTYVSRQLRGDTVMEPHETGRLQLAASVLSQTLDFDEIEEVLRREPGLTFEILQLASQGRAGETKRQVQTIRDALVIVGSIRIQRWIAVLLARSISSSDPEALLPTLTRARAAEMISEARGHNDARLAFAAGMLSCFEKLFQMSSDTLEQELTLTEALREAAFSRRTPLGRLIHQLADRQASEPTAMTVAPTSAESELDFSEHSEITVALASAFLWAVGTTLTEPPDYREV